MNKGLLFLSLIMALFLVANALQADYKDRIIWPKPSVFTATPDAKPLLTSPCGIHYQIQATPPSAAVREMLDFYLQKAFNCPANPKTNTITVTITVSNSTVMTPTQLLHQDYELKITDNLKWAINAKFYAGFVRGLQTFSQLFVQNDQKDIDKKYTVNGVGLQIMDKPQFQWRGVMIDTSRHFLPVDTIKHTIDGLMYNKLNVLHWHMTDQESFPLQLQQSPQVTKAGALSGTYSAADVSGIIDYAKKRAIRVVVEIDTPAHTRSWGLSDKYKDIIVQCDGSSGGQFDPTLDKTYELVQKVMKQVNSQFPDAYLHFGGDQIYTKCWDLKPSIKEWMNAHNMSNYQQLEIYYRKRQKQIFRKFSNKTVIYWANEELNLPMQDEDVIHWWGKSTSVSKMNGTKNKVILSDYDLTYLDIGFGNVYGNSYGTMITWRGIYGIQPNVAGVNVIGGQATMWSEINTPSTQDVKLWPRASALAERFWNSKVDFQSDQATLVARLRAQEVRMRKRGFKVAPLTSGLCQYQPEICFNGLH